MVPDSYSHEKLALEHRFTLLCEAERERMLAVADSPTHASSSLQRLAGRLGIALGAGLQHFEEQGKAV